MEELYDSPVRTQQNGESFLAGGKGQEALRNQDFDNLPFSPETLKERPVYTRFRKRRTSLSSPQPPGPDGTPPSGKFSASPLSAAEELAEGRQDPKDHGDQDMAEEVAPKTPPSRRTPQNYSVSSSKKKERRGGGEEEEVQQQDQAEQAHDFFAAALARALQGHISYLELVAQCEDACRDLSDAVREEAGDRLRPTEDHTLRHKSTMLHQEAATWSLLRHILRPSEEEALGDCETLAPSPSQQDAALFIEHDEQAQVCMRVVLWLQSMASLELDRQLERRGSYVGAYSQQFGVWRQTVRGIRERAQGVGGGQDGSLVRHVDPDAPSREQGSLHPEDQRFEEGLMEDIWKLLRAGRLHEARQLCRNAGQAWRAATLGGCGDEGPSPTLAGWLRSDRAREAQAAEMESGRGLQRTLWKYAAYCTAQRATEAKGRGRYEAAVYASQCSHVARMLPVCSDWETACWALTKAWLDCQVDTHLARHVQSSAAGVSWPQPIADQQPLDFDSLFQKLHSSTQMPEAVKRSSTEPQHQLQMALIVKDVARILDLLKAWIVPSADSASRRPACNPHLVRCGALLVLLLRQTLVGFDSDNPLLRERLRHTGDLIINTYAVLLFAMKREDLVATYACQLAPYLCEDLYIHMMDLRQADSVGVKRRLMSAALQHLPFQGRAGSVLSILDRVLEESREIRRGGGGAAGAAWHAHRRSEALRKARAAMWLCLPPPDGLPEAQLVTSELTARAVLHSTVLLREFALGALGPSVKGPVEAHVVLSQLAHPLAEAAPLLLSEPLSVDMALLATSLHEFDCWNEYYACDGLYRTWLEADLANADVPASALTMEEQDRAVHAAVVAADASMALLQRGGGTWLVSDRRAEEEEEEELQLQQYPAPSWLVLEVVGAVRTSSGAHISPDAATCAALGSGLLSVVSEAVIQRRQLTVEVGAHPRDDSQVLVAMRCTPEEGATWPGTSELDGGLLAAVLCNAIKGELPRFQQGTTLQVTRVDAWAVVGPTDQAVVMPAVVRGLCRRCCLPELALRALQMVVYLVAAGRSGEAAKGTALLELCAQSPANLSSLFTSRQLQELLRLQRELVLLTMEAQEATFAPTLQ